MPSTLPNFSPPALDRECFRPQQRILFPRLTQLGSLMIYTTFEPPLCLFLSPVRRFSFRPCPISLSPSVCCCCFMRAGMRLPPPLHRSIIQLLSWAVDETLEHEGAAAGRSTPSFLGRPASWTRYPRTAAAVMRTRELSASTGRVSSTRLVGPPIARTRQSTQQASYHCGEEFLKNLPQYALRDYVTFEKRGFRRRFAIPGSCKQASARALCRHSSPHFEAAATPF